LHERAEAVVGDLLSDGPLDAAFGNVDVAFYLVHSMGDRGDFVANEARAASAFADAAAAAGVKRIVYLGGLFPDDAELSPHMQSRHQVGEILRASGVPVLELRASVVIGAGSLSFELIRSLVDRLPVMITPRWVDVPAQPISVDDLLDYLLISLTAPLPKHQVYEVGGAEVCSYGEIMMAYAAARGLPCRMIRVPLLTPRLSSLWLGLVTPVYARVGRRLIGSMRHPSVVNRPGAEALLGRQPVGVAEAISRACTGDATDGPRWNDVASAAGVLHPRPAGAEPPLTDHRTRQSSASPAAVFAAVESIGGRRGWYFGDILWQVRGYLDLLVGGVGMRRGRPHPTRLRCGDIVDCWRVSHIERPRHLCRVAEMRLPGLATLEFTVTDVEGGTRIEQLASFWPEGAWGTLYWYSLWPVHSVIFPRLLAGLVRSAELAESDCQRL
jgi:uncharacterized protein YbjT (DUF2867 family)